MTGSSFDGIARQLGRRHALQALGFVAAAAAGGVSLADAKKRNNNNRNNKKKNRKQKNKNENRALALCAGQVAECDAFIAEDCEGNEECVAQGQLCCDLLATCSFTEFIACITAPSNDPNE